MKLLITGDWHYRSQNPISRVDNFQETLNAKLREVGQIAQREDVDAIIVPGDIFDSPTPAYSTLTALEQILREMKKPILTVPGNHDEFGHALESLERTAYGHLAATGLIRDLIQESWVEYPVVVEGHGFSTNTDNDISDYLCKNDHDWISVVVAHGMLLEHEPGFELKHTLLEDVARHPDCPKICIVGHEHLGFGVKRLPRAAGGEVVFINPGAVVRLSAHPGEMERTVQVCLLEVYPGTPPECHSCGVALLPENASSLQDGDEYIVTCPKCGNHSVVHYAGWGPPEVWSIGSPVVDTTLIPLKSARPGHEVLSRDHLEAQADREAKMTQFLGLLAQEGEARFLDIQAIVEGIARSENLPRDVVDEALRRIAAAREAIGGKRGAA